MEDFKLWKILVIATRHTTGAHDELRNKGQIVTNERKCAYWSSNGFAEHLTGHLWPPMMDRSNEGKRTPPIMT